MGDPTREALRAKLLEVGEKCVVNNGLAAVKARSVATQAGCAVGSIYNAYATLDDLILAINNRTLIMLGDELTNAVSNTQGFAGLALSARLQVLAGAYQQFAELHVNRWRAVFEHHMKGSRVVPDWYRDRRHGLFQIVENALFASITDPLERQRASRALFAAVHGILALSMDSRLDNFDPKETAAQIRFIVERAGAGIEQLDT